MKRKGTTLFRQTLIVLVGALILSHFAGFVTLVLAPPGWSNVATLSGIARQLAEPVCEKRISEMEDIGRIFFSRHAMAPQVPAGMTRDPLLQGQLAQVLDAPMSAVRLAWSPESEIRTRKAADVTIGGRDTRLEETVFLEQVFFARQWPDYWCVGEIAPPRWYQHWKVRTALNLVLSLLVFLSLAWWFARRLSRPIHDFATAADAIGRSEQAPMLEEKGPAEMRIAARALNAMQSRIQSQAREREAMIASIAHDLRTPLSRVAFRVETATPEISEAVQRDIEQMNAIITTTLQFTREGIAPRVDTIIDLYPLLKTMVEDEQAIGRDLRWLAESDSLLIRGSDVQLNRLFQNLLDNARHFGGSAEVFLRRDHAHAIVEIADRGPGIEEDRLDEMLLPFSRGEPSRNRQTGGIGLGLSIARLIAQRHGGTIELANREGGGLRVTVTLPLIIT